MPARLGRRLLWPVLFVGGLVAAAVFFGGDRDTLRLPRGTLIPAAEAQFRPNTCETCHAGLRGVEEIHPLFALRCVDCHLGNDADPTKDGAHVPRPGGFGVTATDNPPLTFPLSANTHVFFPNVPAAQLKELRYFPVFRSELSPGGDDPA